MSARFASVSAACARASMSSGGVFDVAGLRIQLEELDSEMARPDLWDDPEAAQRVGRQKNAVERELALHDRVENGLDDAEVLLELAEEAEDAEADFQIEDLAELVSILDPEASGVEGREEPGGPR